MFYLLLICLVPMVSGYSSHQSCIQKSTCKCMSYYLCKVDFNTIKDEPDDPDKWGTLDLRELFFNGTSPTSNLYCCEDRMEWCCEARRETAVITKPKPKQKDCGYRNSKGLDFNLIRDTGKESLFGEFPWVVAILNGKSYYGVGSLIHPRVVVTAAHVVKTHTIGSLKIIAGEWDTMTTKERLKNQKQLVKEVFTHADFNPSKSLDGNDIALLLLEEPIQLDEHINVICMPDQNEDFSQYKNCVANGWGKDSYGPQSRYAHILKRVEIDMVERKRCQSQLSRILHRRLHLHSSFICAGGGEEGEDTCQGDGGAPLACPIGNDRYKLSGLVVAGVRCGEEGVPAVYSDVAKFRQWVDNKMAGWGLETTGYNV